MLLAVGAVAWSRAGTNELERFVVGTWECAGVYTDTATAPDDYRDGVTLQAPFDVFAGETDRDAVSVQTYRAPYSSVGIPAATARIAMHPDGRFATNGIDIFGETYRTGSWAREGGQLVVRFNDHANNHAMQLNGEQTHAEVLTWRDRSVFHTPELTEVRIDRHECGVHRTVQHAHRCLCVALHQVQR